MKRMIIIAVLICSFAFTGQNAFAQVDTKLLSLQDLINYTDCFNTFQYDIGEFRLGESYHGHIPADEKQRIWVLAGFMNSIDTPLEVALLCLCTGGMDLRPMEPAIEKLLPKNNKKQNETKLGAVVFQDMQILNFLGDKAAVGRYEAVLKWIAGLGNVTRPEIETFYKNGVQELITRVVDEKCKGQKTPDRIPKFRDMLITFFKAPSQAAYAPILKEYQAYNEMLTQVETINNELNTANAMLASGKNSGWTADLIKETQDDIDNYKNQIKTIEASWGKDHLEFDIISALSHELIEKLQKDAK